MSQCNSLQDMRRTAEKQDGFRAATLDSIAPVTCPEIDSAFGTYHKFIQLSYYMKITIAAGKIN